MSYIVETISPANFDPVVADELAQAIVDSIEAEYARVQLVFDQFLRREEIQ